MTGNQDNILGVCFTQKNNEPLEIIEWDLKTDEPIRTSISEVQAQVLSGLRLSQLSQPGVKYTLLNF